VLHHRRQVLPQLRVRRRAFGVRQPPGPAHRGVGRTGDRRGADGGGRVEHTAQVVLGGADRGLVSGDQLPSRRHDEADGRTQPEAAEHGRRARGVPVAQLLDRQLEHVEPPVRHARREGGDRRVVTG
jgi:hypothetical protein